MRRILAVVVSLTIVGVGLRYALSGALPDASIGRWELVLPCTLTLLLANNVICALRWRLVGGSVYSRAEAVRRYSEAAFLSTVFPFSGDVYRAWGGRDAVDAVVTDRLLASGVIGAGAVAAAASLGASLRLWLVTVGVGMAAPVLLIARRAVVKSGVPRGTLAGAGGLTVAYIAVSAAGFLLLFRAAGIDATAYDAALVAPLVLAAAAVPNIAGLGPGLFVLGWYARRLDGSPAKVATVVALVLLIQIVLAVMGGASLLTRTVRYART